jgi:hypothetical protein
MRTSKQTDNNNSNYNKIIMLNPLIQIKVKIKIYIFTRNLDNKKNSNNFSNVARILKIEE